MAVCYPYHPLFGQTIAIGHQERFLGGELQFRVVTESGAGARVPIWMFDASSFDASPVEHPLVNPSALLDLHALVVSALSSLDVQSHEADKEDEPHGTASPVSTPGDDYEATGRRDAT
jgi:hypothetical protein